jgi:hypothetical protein
MPSRKKLFGVAFNQLCTASLPRCHLQISVPANVLSKVQTSESPMAPISDPVVDVSTPQISENLVYLLYAQPCGGGRYREATIISGVSNVSQASTRSLACSYIEIEEHSGHAFNDFKK